jgi:hypothetical protein
MPLLKLPDWPVYLLGLFDLHLCLGYLTCISAMVTWPVFLIGLSDLYIFAIGLYLWHRVHEPVSHLGLPDLHLCYVAWPMSLAKFLDLYLFRHGYVYFNMHDWTSPLTFFYNNFLLYTVARGHDSWKQFRNIYGKNIFRSWHSKHRKEIT